MKRWANGDSSVPIVTDIPANAGSFGNTVLILASDHNDVGDATVSGLFLLRNGYSGDNIAITKVAELVGSGAFSKNITTSVVNGYVALKGYRKYLTIECRL